MQRMIDSRKKVREIFILNLAIIFLILCTSYMPDLSIIGVLLFPIPMVILCVKQDIKMALVSIIIGAVMAVSFIGTAYVFPAVLLCGVSGIIIGYIIKRGKSSRYIIFTMIVTWTIVIVFNILFILICIKHTTLYNIVNNQVNYFDEFMNELKQLNTANGISQNEIPGIDILKNIINTRAIMNTIPASILIYVFSISYINYLIIRSSLRKDGINIREGEKVGFTKLYIPNLFGAFLIVLLCIGIMFDIKKIPLGGYFKYSTFYFICFILMVDGMSAFSYFLINKCKWKKGFTAFVLVIALFTFIITLFIYIGVADFIFDFRKLDPNRLLKGRMNNK